MRAYTLVFGAGFAALVIAVLVALAASGAGAEVSQGLLVGDVTALGEAVLVALLGAGARRPSASFPDGTRWG